MARNGPFLVICINSSIPKTFEQRVGERLLAEVVYSILFYIYGSLLIVWYSMYDEISYNVAEKD